MSLESYHPIESLPPRTKIQRYPGMVGKVERFKNNPAPSGYPVTGYGKNTKPQITSPMGMRMHPNDKTRKPHRGVDIAGGGLSCKSTGDGIIVEIGRNNSKSGAGNYITINHGNGFVTRYMHLKTIASSVIIGEAVKKGSTIGITGATGNVTGPHLHYEVIYLDYSVPYIANNTVSRDKWIDPVTTFTPGRDANMGSIRTLAGYTKNLKTSKSVKTNTQDVNEYLITSLDMIDADEDESLDEVEIVTTPIKQDYIVEPRKIIYRINEGLVLDTNRFRSNPRREEVKNLLNSYRANIEFDIGGYASREQAWIINHLAKIANYIIKTAREFTTTKDYQNFMQPLFDLYGIYVTASDYQTDLNQILKLASLIKAYGLAQDVFANSYTGSTKSDAGKTTIDSLLLPQISVISQFLYKYDKNSIDHINQLSIYYSFMHKNYSSLISSTDHKLMLKKFYTLCQQVIDDFSKPHLILKDGRSVVEHNSAKVPIHKSLYKNKYNGFASNIAQTYGYLYTGIWDNDMIPDRVDSSRGFWSKIYVDITNKIRDLTK